MKKISIYFLSLLLTAAAGFTACTTDDDGNDPTKQPCSA